MQVFVPLNTAVTYAKTKDFARAIALLLETRHPDAVISRMQKALRKGKVFVDWSQNDEKKTTVCVYSLRAKERPAVSTPVMWEEVEATLKKGRASGLTFEAEEVLKRVAKHGDLFAPVLTLKQKLPPLRSISAE
jgi:bifunctional non-homologous end joining protein LigD